ncbi:pyrroline-5-carboxylate reductase 3-like [Tetranychus urticae]|uniref:Pyrroline-5-carboxylate reductase 3 n=1 Tax=Tetranychus urticae TaxID=32264 RepID=T1K1E7_TETUR|nr:pyrroline-5-carboxylate reductase 3-like [Tetranychus urticae]
MSGTGEEQPPVEGEPAEVPQAEGEATQGSQTNVAQAAEGAEGGEPQAEGVVEGEATQGSQTNVAAAEEGAQPTAEGTTPSVPSATKASRESSTGAKKRSRSTSRKRGDLDLTEAKIGFIGAGKITEAIVEGLLEFGQIQPSQIHVATPSGKNMDYFKGKGIKTCKRTLEIFARFDCDIIFLCFHGRVIKECYAGSPDRPRAFCVNYIPYMKHPLYILSMVSHCTADEIMKAMLNPDHPDKYKLEFHRIMINAGCAYGLGVCAIDCDPDSKHLSAPLRTLLSRIAKLEYVPKDQIDAACATGGYGLAFAYYFISAMADGAFKVGLARDMAIRFAAKTSQCGAQTLLESGVHPDQLRDSVIAPGGAAIEGIHSLEKTDFSFAVTSAIEAAYQKEKTLSELA